MIRMFTCGEVPLMDIVELQGKIYLQAQAEDRIHHDEAKRSKKDSANGDFSEKEDLNEKQIFLGEVLPDSLRASGCTLRMGTLRVEGSRETLKCPILVLKGCDSTRRKTISTQIHQRLRREAKEGQKKDHKRRREEGCEKDFPGCDDVGDTVLFSEWIDAHPEYLSLDYLFFGGGQGNGSRGIAGDRSYQDDSDGILSNTFSHSSSTGVKFHNELSPDHSLDGIVKAEGCIDIDKLGDESLSNNEREEKEADIDGGNNEMFKDYEVVGLVEEYVVFNGKPARVFA